jgi:hypothetical protein
MDNSRFTLSPSPPLHSAAGAPPSNTAAETRQELLVFVEDVANAFGIQPEYRKHLYVLIQVSLAYGSIQKFISHRNHVRLHLQSPLIKCVSICISNAAS